MKLFCSKFIPFLLVFFYCHLSTAQSPEGINYQAALRDGESGEALQNQMVFLIITIREGGPSGTIVYSESHSGITTNGFGLINLVIGAGDATEGSFAEIPWSSGNIWYEIEVDSGTGLESLGASQFLSVPYALFAGNTEASLDNDSTNELIDSASFNQENQTITIEEGENEVSFTLDGLDVDDADADPTNELIDSAEFDPETQTISIDESGNLVNVSLEGLNVDDGDSDATNELITTAGYDAESNTIILTQADGSEVNISLADLNVSDNDANPANELLSGVQLGGPEGFTLIISEAGENYSVNLDVLVDDEDADLTNELIDESGFSLINDTILSLSEAGIDHFVNLAPLKEDNDWSIDEGNSRVYNEGDKIGIGTNAPAARLEVVEESNTSTALSVFSGTESMIHVANERVGIATTSPLSTIQLGGSVGYDIALLETDVIDNYTADIDDHM
ncbi:MAG TPA: hypothetical protein VJ949_13560, partial [Cryomorphaceae bacterium]|nr:hypothetical protein [Cryomorphaceae bacterium]